MGGKRFTYLFLSFAIALAAMISSCQKDSASAEPEQATTSVAVDSTTLSSPGNFLAARGKLTVTYNDSTYTFDAANDSIAFINVHVDNNIRYFGITAINKDHSMSFGISSAGFAYNNISRGVAGSQLLLATDYKKPAIQLSLSKYSKPSDLGKISIEQYNQGKELAKGTFTTYLAGDDKANSPYYKVEGTFDLQIAK